VVGAEQVQPAVAVVVDDSEVIHPVSGRAEVERMRREDSRCRCGDRVRGAQQRDDERERGSAD